jgi:HlyD family secretion protein
MLKNYGKMIGYILSAIMIGVIVFLAKDYIRPSNEFEGIASGNGRLETIQVDITAKYGGRVMDIDVQEGDMVKKGQLLVTLDTKELEAQLKVALAGVEQAKQNKNYAQAIVSQRESELKLREKNFLRTKSLYDGNSIA